MRRGSKRGADRPATLMAAGMQRLTADSAAGGLQTLTDRQTDGQRSDPWTRGAVQQTVTVPTADWPPIRLAQSMSIGVDRSQGLTHLTC